VDIIYGQADHIDINDFAFEAYPTEPWDLERLKETCFICQPALFFRRRVVEKNGALNESLNYCMDYEYWLRLGSAKNKFLFIKNKLAGSRLYADNKTIGSRVKVHWEINNVMKVLFGRVPDRWIYNYAHAVSDKFIQRESHPRKYIYCMVACAIFAAMKWNFEISKSMRSQMQQWLFKTS
jgi:hypothetical protein